MKPAKTTTQATRRLPEAMNSLVTLDLQIVSQADNIPSQSDILYWVETALVSRKQDSELTIRIVDQTESQQLNHQYRHRDYPTNVLSFPADLPEHVEIPLLGDVIICAPVVSAEAQQQGKAVNAHWAHMVVHGCLHLLGYDHIEDEDATEMETLEQKLLMGMGFADPYEESL